jgi:predicted nucleotide-binding protein
MGYHASVYYDGFRSPPAGANFSPEWGLMETFAIEDTKGDWKEFNRDKVIEAIYRKSGDASLDPPRQLTSEIENEFSKYKGDVLSILTASLSMSPDEFLADLKRESTRISFISSSDVIDAIRPKGQIWSRDSLALSQGLKVPPHYSVVAEVESIRSAGTSCKRLGEVARKAGSHLARVEQKQNRAAMVGTNVFIGHGSSKAWRELKDFVQDRLHLPYDEFNRVPIAGVTNIARLSEMLNGASVAFLVMTGEDEQVDGKLHARMNVIHEAGLFQGRLGFTRAIVLLEEGCEAFSNIEGLGQIRFPTGEIKAVFEDIRRVLEREGIIKESTAR